MISFDEFKKLEIKIGKILSAERVEGSDKLIRLEIDLGEEKRQIVAGIGLYYDPLSLPGKEIPVIANLEFRKLLGVESQGMMLAAEGDGRPVLLHPEKEVSPGSIVK